MPFLQFPELVKVSGQGLFIGIAPAVYALRSAEPTLVVRPGVPGRLVGHDTDAFLVQLAESVGEVGEFGCLSAGVDVTGK